MSGRKSQFGATVKLGHDDTGEEQTFQIVGSVEADIKHSLGLALWVGRRR
ncbi:GreA/GreB family elongation factor [Nannocystis sp. bb15-2]|uniref:GreA/GreB family elongation factor n=1 Tax=Nannocystis bainbridge TaxID=2995303 RepID=A0ABT5E6Z8_9BACT|nr:GreA/GreB family elongation factor [Nannocystis bainbridge]MDC0721175.1 GreA/GreB family elongation factor [Nannocystis bainbridge]